jgi:hypothetical protein
VEEGTRVTLSVSQGAAELASTVGAVMVESGQTSHVTQGEAPDIARPFNTASFDEFDAWSDRRDQGASIVRNLGGGRSVPYEVESHVSDLSSYGDWATDSVYGTVWYPNVGLGWSPYSSGRWCYTRFGYTWASYEPWGWAPYHYGRWGYNPRGWYWMPGSVWSPAWVSFAFGPYWVGWSPLGHHNRPVFGFDSHFRGHGGRRHAKPGHPWGPSDRGSGWNFASRDQFRGRWGGMRRLDENLIRETAPRARLFESGAVLDRDLRPRGSRETSGDSPSARRFAERRSQSGSRARVEPGVPALNRTETPSMPRAFTAPSENARGRSAADRPSSGSTTVSPWMRSRSNDSEPRSGRSAWNASPSSREGRDSSRSAMGRRSSTEPPGATVVPPRGNAPSSPRGTASPSTSWRTMGRGGSSRGRESSRTQSFDRGSRPSSSWSSPSSSRSSSRAATSRGSSRGSDRGGGGSSRNSGGGRSRSNRN